MSVKEFDDNGRGAESPRRGAATARTTWSSGWTKQGFKVVKSGGDIDRRRQRLQRLGAPRRGSLLGRLGGQPGRRARAAREGLKGNVVGEVRHKAKGSTIRDAVENGLEDVAKALAEGSRGAGRSYCRKATGHPIDGLRTRKRAPGREAASCYRGVVPFRSGDLTLAMTWLPEGAIRFLTPHPPSPSPIRG